jgi:hypothetical protein
MIDCEQFREYVIRDTLQNVFLKRKSPRGEGLHDLVPIYSMNMEEILIATIAHESQGGTFLCPKNKRTRSLGVYQMHSQTYQDIIDKLYNNIEIILADGSHYYFPSNPREIITNLSTATLMSALYYQLIPDKLPPHDDINKIWEFYNENWGFKEKNEESSKEFIKNYYNYAGFPWF